MKYLAVIFLLVWAYSLKAQNLVPNYSFEEYSTCPYSIDQIHFAVPWFDPTQTSTDFFHACQPNPLTVGVPLHFSGSSGNEGFQFPRTGNGYVGINVYGAPTSPNWREYLQCELIRPLETGKRYCVTFYVNLANPSTKAANRIGAYFSPDSVTGPVTSILPYTPQVDYSASTLKDTLNWMEIKGEFIAVGGERFITIGNFYNDQNTTVETVNTSGPPQSTYYYIDDVSVYEASDAYAGQNKEICPGDTAHIGAAAVPGLTYSWWPPTGLTDPTSANPVASPAITTSYHLTVSDTSGKVCLGVTTDTVTVTLKQDCELVVNTLLAQGEPIVISGISEQPTLTIFDTRGRLLYRNENYDNSFYTTSLATASYILLVRMKDGIEKRVKMIVVK